MLCWRHAHHGRLLSGAAGVQCQEVQRGHDQVSDHLQTRAASQQYSTVYQGTSNTATRLSRRTKVKLSTFLRELLYRLSQKKYPVFVHFPSTLTWILFGTPCMRMHVSCRKYTDVCNFVYLCLNLTINTKVSSNQKTSGHQKGYKFFSANLEFRILRCPDSKSCGIIIYYTFIHQQHILQCFIPPTTNDNWPES